ncbi:MlaD family protein [Geopsychrobacter electrodiphilus]|uniref:MlaD family protein n=1 Tax=Geopsychrobacter electrodiphilus TaxID=225196 RepID=UPI00036559F4|nr:MlaD family protein [Geopsychrobacter electrodiphilus]
MYLKTAIRVIFSAMLLLLLFGCKDSPLQFSVQFETLGDLKAKVPVYLDETRIGKVDQITSTDDGNFLVKVSIAPEYRSKLTQNAKFYIGQDPQNANSSALRGVQKVAGGTPLEDGTIVQGVKAPSLIDSLISALKQNADEASATLQHKVEEFKLSAAAKSNELSRQLEKSLADINQQFRELDLSNRFTPSDEEISQLKDALDTFIDEFERAGKQLQDQLRTEVIPQLRQELEALKKRLERDRREEKIKEIEVKLNELTAV